jgi:hypothetical protein
VPDVPVGFRLFRDAAAGAEIGANLPEIMVLPERIELSTSPLPRECSTTELRQRRFGKSPLNGRNQIHDTPAIGKLGATGAGQVRVSGEGEKSCRTIAEITLTRSERRDREPRTS